ncbi:MAG TPA: PrsW family glutamic-type intramembrane protease [Gemmatimonas sp.]|uniref:PrsW family glutamic-type intramembrane protease n=1 Tax=Gemmatimonas sp. TaxID=1962908 RepID=UPI002EDA2AB5
MDPFDASAAGGNAAPGHQSSGTGAPRAVSGTHLLVCIAGPDLHKRILVGATPVQLGTSADCAVLSDDPEVVGAFARIRLDGQQVRIDALGTLPLYIDGHSASTVVARGRQQVRIGRSLWEVHITATPVSVFDFVNRMGDHLSNAAGIEKPGEWSAREMFADVTKKHEDSEIEANFTVGTALTTPQLGEIDSRWPRPWVFVRVCILSLVLYWGFLFAWDRFHNVNLIPGLIMIGSVAIPLSLLLFFFEVNVPRNVSLYQVIRLLFTGGLVSIIVSLFLFDMTESLSNWLGAASAGIVEETGKVLTLLLVVRDKRFRWTLNGLLLGATVGAGFAIFESAGYALRAALGPGGDVAMRDTIMSRGVLTLLGGHVLWTGLTGAALWRVREDKPFDRAMFGDVRFLRVLGVTMVLHMLWNADFALPIVGYYGKFLVLGAATWLLVLGMIQSGLRQVREAQAQEAIRRSGQMEAQVIPISAAMGGAHSGGAIA